VEKSQELNFQYEEPLHGEKKSILVVDDSGDLLEIQKIILRSDGFEVFTAQSGTDALRILSEIDKPELILLDVQMCDMNGPEFLKMLASEKPEITATVPIVFLTAMDQIPEGDVQGFIRKPFEIGKFLEAVHRFIDLGRNSPCYH